MQSDRRTRYTKQVIREAMENLLKNNSLEKITVKELCAEADINRATFYRYYTDIYDLFASIERELVKEVFEKGDLDERKVNERLMEVIYQNQGFYREFFRSHLESAYVQKQIVEKYQAFFGKIQEEWDEQTAYYTFQYMKDGIIGVLKAWVESGCNETPEQMEQIVMGIVKKQL